METLTQRAYRVLWMLSAIVGLPIVYRNDGEEVVMPESDHDLLRGLIPDTEMPVLRAFAEFCSNYVERDVRAKAPLLHELIKEFAEGEVTENDLQSFSEDDREDVRAFLAQAFSS